MEADGKIEEAIATGSAMLREQRSLVCLLWDGGQHLLAAEKSFAAGALRRSRG